MEPRRVRLGRIAAAIIGFRRVKTAYGPAIHHAGDRDPIPRHRLKPVSLTGRHPPIRLSHPLQEVASAFGPARREQYAEHILALEPTIGHNTPRKKSKRAQRTLLGNYSFPEGR